MPVPVGVRLSASVRTVLATAQCITCRYSVYAVRFRRRGSSFVTDEDSAYAGRACRVRDGWAGMPRARWPARLTIAFSMDETRLRALRAGPMFRRVAPRAVAVLGVQHKVQEIVSLANPAVESAWAPP